MKKLRRIISFIMVFLIVFTTLQIKNMEGGSQSCVYAAEDFRNSVLSVSTLSGGTSSTVTATVYDEYTNPVEGEVVEFSTDFGLLDSNLAITDSTGKATVTISSNVSGTAHIQAYIIDKWYCSIETQFAPIGENLDLKADTEWLTEELVLNDNSSIYSVEGYLYLPTTGPNGSTISWVSSDEAMVELDGTVNTQPYNYGLGGTQVRLTATIFKGEAKTSKVFIIYVKTLDPTAEEVAVKADYIWLNYEIICNGFYAFDIRENVILPTLGAEGGSTISWTSSNIHVVAPDGTVNRPTYTQGDTEVTLTATISKGSAEIEKIFNITVIALDPNDAEVVTNDKAWLNDKLVLGANTSLDNIKTDLNFPQQGPSGSIISWCSNNEEVIDSEGVVIRPSAAEGNQQVIITATLSRGNVAEEKIFDITVTVIEDAPLAVKLDDFSNVDDMLQLNGTSTIVDTQNQEGHNIRALQFDSDTQSPGGSAFTRKKIHLTEDMSFSTAFAFRTKNSPYALGNGGFTFTLQADDNRGYGISSDSLGTEGIQPSLSVAFDTYYYRTQGSGGPGSSWERGAVKVFFNGIDDSQGNGRVRFFGDLTDSEANHLWIEYDGASKILEVRISSTMKKPFEPTLQIEGIDLGDIFTNAQEGVSIQDVQDVYVGFTGSTGNADEQAQIWNWYFKNNTNPIDIGSYNFLDASHISLSADPAAGASTSTVTAMVYGIDHATAGVPVEFTTTFGSLDSYVGITDSSGKASVILSSHMTGTAVVTAIAAGGAFASTEVQLALTDADRVAADTKWLTDERILNSNSSLDNITEDLNFPIVGPSGSNISWASSNDKAVSVDGRVTTPSPAEGDQIVEVTATISKGATQVTKTFNIAVKVVEQDIVSADNDWLTYERILNGNSALDSITQDLYLPENGEYGSAINWITTNEDVVSTNGTVTRPTYIEGDQVVELTVTISKGSESIHKTFEVIVKALKLTDAKAMEMDKAWLDVSRILGENFSQFSIQNNLSLPDKAPHGSLITWSSDLPEVISDEGIVNRPQHQDGHKTVTITATLQVGEQSDTKKFEFTVLSIPDKDAPQILATTPVNNSTDVRYDSRQITVVFNEKIQRGPNWDNIKLYYSSYSIRIDENELIITLNRDMAFEGEYELIIPAGAVADSSGNFLEDEFRLSYSVEQRQLREIEIISSNPNDREMQACVESNISFSYNYSDILEDWAFNYISLRARDGAAVPITRHLNGETVTLSLQTGAELKPGVVYEILIPSGAVRDRYKNKNKEETIQFRIQSEDTIPTINSTYPIDGQEGIDIHQVIEIMASENVRWNARGIIQLLDDKGNRVAAIIDTIDRDYGTFGRCEGVLIEPINPLEPQTEYTVLLPYDSVRNLSNKHMAFDYSMRFTTGANSLNICKVNPTDEQAPFVNVKAAINTSIEIEFSSPVSKVPESDNIEILNSKGDTVLFDVDIIDNKVVLVPLSDLQPSETYTVDIPANAYKNESGDLNNNRKFMFTTATKLVMGIASFTAKPSLSYLVNKPLTFDAEWIENRFNSAGYEIVSYQWDFGDGDTADGKRTEHAYHAAGKYTVTLRIEDNKGFTYAFEETVRICMVDSNTKMTVSPWYTRNLLKTGSNNFEIYTIDLSYNGIFLPGEKVNVFLYKNGVLEEELGSITTDNKGKALFPFWYERERYYGEYELVFVHGSMEKGTVVRRSVVFRGEIPAKPIIIKLYDKDERDFSDIDKEKLLFELDGNTIYGEREWLDQSNGYCYVIDDVKLGTHNLKLLNSSTSLEDGYYSDIKEVKHGFDGTFIVLVVKNRKKEIEAQFKPPTIEYVKSDRTDSRNYFDTTFIEGVDINPLKMEIKGQWNGYFAGRRPGYYEIWCYRVLEGKIHTTLRKTSYSNIISINPAYDIGSGAIVLVRMVKEDGTMSKWVNAGIQVIPKPDKVNVIYRDGKYIIDKPMGLNSSIGGNIGILKDIPLLGDASFGWVNHDYRTSGMMDENNIVELYFKGNYGDEFPQKQVGLMSSGYAIGAEVEGVVSYSYEPLLQRWFGGGSLTLIGDGSYYWKKSYEIPVINVGIEPTLSIGSQVGATINYNYPPYNDQYSSIIYFSPYVKGSLNAGLGWVSVEGYVQGSVNCQYHIPTGYMQVAPTIKAGIDAHYAFWTKEIIDAEISHTLWDNDKKPILYAADTYCTELKPMSRKYVDNSSTWQAGNIKAPKEMLLASAKMEPFSIGQYFTYNEFDTDEANPNAEIMKDNIYPNADVCLIRNDDELWLVWTDDNRERSSMNRTQMNYSILKDGIWSQPKWIGDDGTADFSPTVASTGNGVLMAWQNIAGKMEEDVELGEFINNAEISVTESVYTEGSSDVQVVTLTDDDKYDHSPKLAADGDNALLVWTKSEGLGFTLGEDMEMYRSPENSDSLIFSKWNGNTWSMPIEIEGALPTVMNASLNMNGNSGLLTFTLDMDNDLSTQEDREIFAKIYDGSSWGGKIRLTDNQVSDSNPKVVYSDGEWFITWYQQGSIVYKEGLDGETKSQEFLSKVEGDYKIAIKDGSQIALIYKKMGHDNTRALSVSFYDIQKGVWSDEVALTEAEEYIRSFSPVFSEDGKLNIAFTQAELITEVIEGTEWQKPSGKVDLRMLTYLPKHDLALDEEVGLKLYPEIPRPCTMTKVSVTIQNRGDFAENATLYLYDGNPEEGGIKIGEASTKQPIPARSSAQVEVEWLVNEEERDEYNIYVVVQPDEGVTEIDENNNTLSYEIATADIAAIDVKCENVAKDDYLIEATLVNIGSRSLEGIRVQLKHEQSGQIVESKEFDALRPGQEADLNFLISSQGLTVNENGEINMTLAVALPDDVKEFSTDNNNCEFKLKPAPIVVEKINPASGETQANIQQPLTFDFNMNVEQGEGFEEIILEDDCLNTIDVHKTVAGNTLTVAPRSLLSYNTRYTLTIPRNALGDSYGHTMNESYSLSFVTTTSSPEVIFAYPGNKLENVVLNTDIKIQFNQDVLEGSTLSEIVLYGLDNKRISSSASIQGEWLYIYPTENLDPNTSYSLMMPAGAVKNHRGEVLQDNYLLEFKTGDELDAGNNDNDSGKEDSSDVEHLIYKITRQTSEDGSSTVMIEIDQQAILKIGSENEETVIVNVSDEVKDDQTILISLNKNAAKQLVEKQWDLQIITGKGDLMLPVGMIQSLVRDGQNVITITIAENNEKETDNHRVSAGIFNFSIAAGEALITEFVQEVVATIPLDMSRVGNAKRVIVCVYDEDTNSWQPVGGVADVVEGTVTFKVRHFSTFAAFEMIKHFDDVTSDWAKKEIEIMASRRLITGKTDQLFDPEGSITRAEFTALIVRSLYTQLLKSRGIFADVDKDAWFADEVEAAYHMGLIRGIGQDRFEPNAQISREQLAVIAYRFFQYQNGAKISGGNDNKFKDQQDISSYAQEAVNFVANAGIMMGSNNRFEPQRSTTRQEAAVVLYRLLEYMGEI